MHQLFQQPVETGVAHVAHTSKSDGDLSPSDVEPHLLVERRRALVDRPWFTCAQVHSDRVLRVSGHEALQGHGSDLERRPVADGLVTDRVGLVLAVHSGDCVPVGFVHSSGAVAVAHAGWKGLAAGVLESTVRALRSGLSRVDGDQKIWAAIGPHIRAVHYEFGATDLHKLTRRFGPQVASTSLSGTPSLDLTAGVEAELTRLDVAIAASSADCTASDPDSYWSHRARNEPGRIALMVWVDHR